MKSQTLIIATLLASLEATSARAEGSDNQQILLEMEQVRRNDYSVQYGHNGDIVGRRGVRSFYGASAEIRGFAGPSLQAKGAVNRKLKR